VQIENLETRVVLSVSLFNGQLAIVGSTKADSIFLNAAGNTLSLVFNGNASNFTLAQVKKISISAAGGNDTVTLTDEVSIPAIIHGGSGNDSLRGGAGPDSLLGEAGNDTLDGAGGADVIFGGDGIDTADYSARTNDLIIAIDDNAGDGEAGENDNVGTGVENIIGGSGNDSVTGSASDNSLNGNGGNDTLLGGAGNDIIDGGRGTDSMSGGDGLDSVTYASRTAGVSIFPVAPFGAPNSGEPGENDSILNDFETLIGGSGDDTMAGFQFFSANPPGSLQIGNAGNDTLTGSFGNDTLRGGAGDDMINGFAGDDNLMDGGDGNDDLEIGQTIDGGGTMLGGAGNDTLASGLSGKVREMHGGPGDDVLAPKTNTLSVTGDAGNDVANFDNGAGFGLDTNLAGTGIDTLIGTVFKDHIVGSDANEVILGLYDNDTIEGNGGDDYIDGGFGLDHLSGGAGDDVFVNGDGLEPDTIDGGDGFDSAQFGGFVDPVHGILVDT
jgi:Ca2+-binding RTX toxin-like protein